MDDSLLQFSEQYHRNGNRMSKYVKYRERYAATIVFGILFLVFGLVDVYRSLFNGFSEIPYVHFIPGAFLITVAIVIKIGQRDMAINSEDITYYEIASAIKSMEEKDIDSTIQHIDALKSEINRNGNDVFSPQTEDRVREYQTRLEESQNPEGILNNTFEDFFKNLIQELSEENEMDAILQDISTERDEEFEGSVVLDSIKRLELDMWAALTIFAAFLSLVIFNFVGKDSGYYSALVLLTTIQIISDQGD